MSEINQGNQMINPNNNEFGLMEPIEGWRREMFPAIGVLTLIATARIAAEFNEDLSIRGVLPDPFDAPNHIGNTAVTFVLMDRFMSGFIGKNPEALTQEEYDKKAKTAAVAVGCLTVAANIFAETVGYGSTSTPDPLDFVYGLSGGALAYFARRPRYHTNDEVNQYLIDAEEDSSLAEIIDDAISQRKKHKETEHLKPSTSDRSSDGSTEKPKPKNKYEQPTGSVKKNKQKAKMQKKSKKKNRRK